MPMGFAVQSALPGEHPGAQRAPMARRKEANEQEAHRIGRNRHEGRPMARRKVTTEPERTEPTGINKNGQQLVAGNGPKNRNASESPGIRKNGAAYLCAKGDERTQARRIRQEWPPHARGNHNNQQKRPRNA